MHHHQTGWKNVFDMREYCAAACMDKIMDNDGSERHCVILRFRMQGKMILAYLASVANIARANIAVVGFYLRGRTFAVTARHFV